MIGWDCYFDWLGLYWIGKYGVGCDIVFGLIGLIRFIGLAWVGWVGLDVISWIGLAVNGWFDLIVLD